MAQPSYIDMYAAVRTHRNLDLLEIHIRLGEGFLLAKLGQSL